VDFVIYILSIGLLVTGANFIIINLELLSMRFKIPRFIMEILLIAFGSSLPEITNSIMANFYNRQAIAISSLIGSSIFNIVLILPVIVIFTKENILNIKRFREDISWLFLATIMFLIVCLDGKIELIEAIFLISIMLLYITSILKKPQIYSDSGLLIDKNFSIIKSIILILISSSFLVIGSYFLIESAISIGNILKLSSWNIGLFIAISIAFLKLTTILSTLFKNRPKIATANIIHSTLSNVTIGVGLSSLIRDIFIYDANLFDFIILALVILMLLIVTSNRIYTKSVSFVFLGLYILFLIKSWNF